MSDDIEISDILQSGLFRRDDWFADIDRALRADGAQAPASTPRKPRAPRKPTLASVAKQAAKASIPVARYEVEPDGNINLVTGKPEPTSNKDDEVESWINKHAH
jgi:hypothetical protein